MMTFRATKANKCLLEERGFGALYSYEQFVLLGTFLQCCSKWDIAQSTDSIHHVRICQHKAQDDSFVPRCSLNSLPSSHIFDLWNSDNFLNGLAIVRLIQ